MGHIARDLAYRFALCIEEGRDDLFNENTEWKHFHGVLSDIFSVTGYERRDVEKMNKETEKRYFRHDLPERALEKLIAYEKKNNQDDNHEQDRIEEIFPGESRYLEIKKYDAILADEVQDYEPIWINVLSRLLKPDGEFVICADMAQDIYKTKKSWTDEAMKGCGFLGKWNELSSCYRLPDSAITIAQNFADRYLPNIETPLIPRQQSLNIEPCYIRWIQFGENSNRDYRDICLREMMHIIESSHLSWSDLYILTPNKDIAFEVDEYLTTFGINSLKTFGATWQKSRANKMQFWSGDARIKISSVQSFKGWESYGTIAILPSDETVAKLFSIHLYIILTRMKRTTKGSWLTILSLSSFYKSFGEWLGSQLDCEYVEI